MKYINSNRNCITWFNLFAHNKNKITFYLFFFDFHIIKSNFQIFNWILGLILLLTWLFYNILKLILIKLKNSLLLIYYIKISFIFLFNSSIFIFADCIIHQLIKRWCVLIQSYCVIILRVLLLHINTILNSIIQWNTLLIQNFL